MGGIKITSFDVEEKLSFELKVSFLKGLRKQEHLRDFSFKSSTIGGAGGLVLMQCFIDFTNIAGSCLRTSCG